MPKIDLGALPVNQHEASYPTAFGKKTNLCKAIKTVHAVDLSQFGVAIDALARHIIKGMRSKYDRAHYPDIDLKYYRDASGRRFTIKAAGKVTRAAMTARTSHAARQPN